MKINFQQLWRSVPKRTAAAGLVLVLAMAPVMLGAWGGKRPTYTIQHPADHVTFNSITDNPNHGDERNFFSVRDTDSKEWDKANKNGWTDTMELKAGHTYEAQIYVHNNAAANLNLVAKNVRVHTNLPVKESTYGHQFEVNAFLWSDNAKPNEIWDNIVLKSDREFHVKVVAQKYFNNARPENSTKGFDLGPELTGSTGRGTGALLGFNQMDGNIPGCFHYDGYVSIKFQPVFRVVPAPKFDLEKQVNRTSIKAGETLGYTLTFHNTGNTNLHNVTVTDKLPASVKLVAGSLKADAKFTGDLEQGMKFAEVKAGQNVTVNFSVTTDETKLQCGKNEVVNTASAVSDEVKHEFQRFLGNNTTKTTVVKTCAPTPEPTPTPKPEPKPEPKQGFDLEKQVNKTVAQAGDSLNYTLTFHNTGETTLHNVVLTDKLPAGTKLVNDSLKSAAKFTGNLEQGIKLAEVKAGESVSLNFAVTTEASALQCGKNDVVNSAIATTDEVKREPLRSLGNNVVKTVVNRVCALAPKPEPKQGFDLEKRVNKTVAQAGDSLNYTLTFHNTGETTLHNVVLTDKLPAGTKLVNDSLKSAAKFTGNLEQGIKLAEVKAGESVSLNFAVTTEASALQCGKNEVVNTAIATTDEVKREPLRLLGNNVVKTVVNRVCAPAPKPAPEPVVPTPVKPTPKPVKKPAPAPAPREIAKTGVSDALSATAMLTILGAMVTAYIRSRH